MVQVHVPGYVHQTIVLFRSDIKFLLALFFVMWPTLLIGWVIMDLWLLWYKSMMGLITTVEVSLRMKVQAMVLWHYRLLGGKRRETFWCADLLLVKHGVLMVTCRFLWTRRVLRDFMGFQSQVLWKFDSSQWFGFIAYYFYF